MDNEFQFFKGLDSFGHDLFFKKFNLDGMKKLAIDTKDCVGFNSLGYFKYYIFPEDKLFKPFTYNSEDGIYIHKDRYKKMLNSIIHKSYINFDNYTFHPGLDSGGENIGSFPSLSLLDLKSVSDNDKNVVGFNMFGDLKNKIKSVNNFTVLHPLDTHINGLRYLQTFGLYVKNKIVRIKILCEWISSKELCDSLNKMSKGNYRWNNIEITCDDSNIDYYVIINKPKSEDVFIPEKTVILQTQFDNKENLNDISKWGVWDKSDFLRIEKIDKYNNYIHKIWNLNLTYNELKMKRFQKTEKIFAFYDMKENIKDSSKFIEFLKFVESKKDDVVKIDIYGDANIYNFENFKGVYLEDKIGHYKYSISMENRCLQEYNSNTDTNFFEEKLWESILCDSLCFYFNSQNVPGYLDPKTYIGLSFNGFNGFEQSFEIVKKSILNNEWEKRVESIREEKYKILDYYNFFPTVERKINNLGS